MRSSHSQPGRMLLLSESVCDSPVQCQIDHPPILIPEGPEKLIFYVTTPKPLDPLSTWQRVLHNHIWEGCQTCHVTESKNDFHRQGCETAFPQWQRGRAAKQAQWSYLKAAWHCFSREAIFLVGQLSANMIIIWTKQPHLFFLQGSAWKTDWVINWFLVLDFWSL